jgi:hypothetical protein
MQRRMEKAIRVVFWPLAWSGTMSPSHGARERRVLLCAFLDHPVGQLVGGVPRKHSRFPPESVILRRIARFFFAPQRPFQAAAVNRDPKVVLNSSDASDGRQPRVGGAQGPHMLEDLGGQLVPFLGPTVLRQQATQATFLESSLSLIDGGARNAERGRHIDDRDSFHTVSAKHLVANLEKILRVEEWILFEQTVGNSVRVGVEGASSPQLRRFLVGLFPFRRPILRHG